MIYSASRRTDMLAFFPDRIVEKVKRSQKLEGIVLWTTGVPKQLEQYQLVRGIRFK